MAFVPLSVFWRSLLQSLSLWTRWTTFLHAFSCVLTPPPSRLLPWFFVSNSPSLWTLPSLIRTTSFLPLA